MSTTTTFWLHYLVATAVTPSSIGAYCSQASKVTREILEFQVTHESHANPLSLAEEVAAQFIGANPAYRHEHLEAVAMPSAPKWCGNGNGHAVQRPTC